LSKAGLHVKRHGWQLQQQQDTFVGLRRCVQIQTHFHHHQACQPARTELRHGVRKVSAAIIIATPRMVCHLAWFDVTQHDGWQSLQLKQQQQQQQQQKQQHAHEATQVPPPSKLPLSCIDLSRSMFKCLTVLLELHTGHVHVCPFS
jgi:hypothetical protein